MQEKTQGKEMDLRRMCDQVKGELEALEQDAAYDYLKVEKEVTQLKSQIDTSDSILEDLENILGGFKDNLGQIKQEMSVLSQKSHRLNIAIGNRT